MKTNPKKYRLLRVLEYEGTMEFIKQSLANRVVKGTMPRFGGKDSDVIRESIIGGVEGFVELNPETLEEVPDNGE